MDRTEAGACLYYSVLSMKHQVLICRLFIVLHKGVVFEFTVETSV